MAGPSRLEARRSIGGGGPILCEVSMSGIVGKRSVAVRVASEKRGP